MGSSKGYVCIVRVGKCSQNNLLTFVVFSVILVSSFGSHKVMNFMTFLFIMLVICRIRLYNFMRLIFNYDKNIS